MEVNRWVLEGMVCCDGRSYGDEGDGYDGVGCIRYMMRCVLLPNYYEMVNHSISRNIGTCIFRNRFESLSNNSVSGVELIFIHGIITQMRIKNRICILFALN